MRLLPQTRRALDKGLLEDGLQPLEPCLADAEEEEKKMRRKMRKKRETKEEEEQRKGRQRNR